MGKVYVFDHPLIQHKTAMLRMKETSTKDFRELVNEIGLTQIGRASCRERV